VIGRRTAWRTATCESPFVVSSCSFLNSIRTTHTGLSRSPTCHGIFQTTSTCRDGLKPRNFPVSSPFHDPCRRLPRDKSPTSPWIPQVSRGSFGEFGVMEFWPYAWGSWDLTLVLETSGDHVCLETLFSKSWCWSWSSESCSWTFQSWSWIWTASRNLLKDIYIADCIKSVLFARWHH